jgi:hypothetical protein
MANAISNCKAQCKFFIIEIILIRIPSKELIHVKGPDEDYQNDGNDADDIPVKRDLHVHLVRV